jgi:hypothetical protein
MPDLIGCFFVMVVLKIHLCYDSTNQIKSAPRCCGHPGRGSRQRDNIRAIFGDVDYQTDDPLIIRFDVHC